VALAKAKGGDLMPFFLSPLGRIAGTFLIAAIAWFGWLSNHDKKVLSRVVSKIEEKNNANAQKAETARRSVADIPVERLFDSYRRD
jgi:hypothetical protein